jgi:FAD-linked oxidoreductase
MTGVGQKYFENWSGSVQSIPKTIVYPASIEDVVYIVQLCRREHRTLRVVGSGHSFTPIVATGDVLVSLDRLQGIVAVDEQALTATVWGGTKLKTLGQSLFHLGLAQENLGDIDEQSIAGAIATGTHGTGRRFGNIATQVVGLTVVTGMGEVVTCTSSSHPDLFKALQVSLGALGIIVQVTLRLRPAFRMVYQSQRVPLAECLRRLPDLADQHRHFEFYWFPYATICQLKSMDETVEPTTSHPMRDLFNKLVLENGALWVVSQASKYVPKTAPAISRLCAATVPVFREVNHSQELFATKRLVRFNEMEYNLPAAEMVPVIEEMQATLSSHSFRVHFPIECRFAKQDDIWLSPAYGRDSAYIAVHMYRGMPHEDYFAAMEEIFLRHGGRPHWGKHHNLGAGELALRYPCWHQFLAIRNEFDPDCLFVNDYLRDLFGLDIRPIGEQVP